MTRTAKAILTDTQSCFVKNFGCKNPDKIFFVIRQGTLGRGLFSLLSAVICYIDFAVRQGFIPVVDFESFRTEYNETELISGTMNAFEYYFYPLNEYTLDEVYESNKVIISSNDYPAGYDYTIANIPDFFRIYQQYIKVKVEFTELAQAQIPSTQRVLGVQFRGQEMRTSPGHWLPPTPKQMYLAIDAMCEEFSYNSIFVSTEDQHLLHLLKTRYPNKIFFNNNFRTQGQNAYKIYPRNNHKFLLGSEILVDMLCLARCDALISCSSNVAWMARYVNNQRYTTSIFINNGPNSSNRFISPWIWKLKSFLPATLGGFKTDLSAFEWSKRNNDLNLPPAV